MTYNLYAAFWRDCTPSIKRFMNKCTSPNSYSSFPNFCKCNLCLRQPTTLRDLASHSVFHFTFNLSEFQITARTLYHHYLQATNSHLVPEHKLIPHTGTCLQSAYARHTLCERETSFHEHFIPDRYVFGVHSTSNNMLVMSKFSRHCVLTEIHVGARFVIGLYSSLLNSWWMMLVNKTQQAVWLYHTQIHFTFLV